MKKHAGSRRTTRSKSGERGGVQEQGDKEEEKKKTRI